jgi:hypothetical protein
MSIAVADLSETEFGRLVEAAVLAPSADNSHTFLFDRSGDRVRLWSDHVFAQAPQPLRILRLISFGAALENIKLRAARLGLNADVRSFPDANEPRLVAELHFARTTSAPCDPLEDAIPNRHTNRRLFFRGPAMSRHELELVSTALKDSPGVRLTWFDSPEARKQILGLITVAETERFASRRLHEELFSAVRFDVGWNATASEGLPPGSLEVEAPMRPMFAALRHWPVMRSLNALGGHHLLGLRAAYLPCRLAPHLGALTTSLDVESGALAAGAALQRVWLRTTLQGFAFQPMAGSALLRFPSYSGVSAKVQARLAEGWDRLAPGRTPLMVFRIGRARPPSVRTGRRPFVDFIVRSGESPIDRWP